MARIRSEPEDMGAIALAQTLQRSGIQPDQYSLLEHLQDAHDFCLREWGVGRWEFEMRAVADRFELKYTAP